MKIDAFPLERVVKTLAKKYWNHDVVANHASHVLFGNGTPLKKKLLKSHATKGEEGGGKKLLWPNALKIFNHLGL